MSRKNRNKHHYHDHNVEPFIVRDFSPRDDYTWSRPQYTPAPEYIPTEEDLFPINDHIVQENFVPPCSHPFDSKMAYDKAIHELENIYDFPPAKKISQMSMEEAQQRMLYEITMTMLLHGSKLCELEDRINKIEARLDDNDIIDYNAY